MLFLRSKELTQNTLYGKGGLHQKRGKALELTFFTQFCALKGKHLKVFEQVGALSLNLPRDI